MTVILSALVLIGVGYLVGYDRGYRAAPRVQPKPSPAVADELVSRKGKEVWIAAPSDAMAADILIRYAR